MPYAFKQLFGKLILLSRKPFQNDGEASNSENLVCDSEYLMGFFPLSIISQTSTKGSLWKWYIE